MSRKLDSEIARALKPIVGLLGATEPPPVGDVETRRALITQLFGQCFAGLPSRGDVDVSEQAAGAADGLEIPMRLYSTPAALGEGLVVYVHGGGMIAGDLDCYDPLLRYLAGHAERALLAMDYRLPPEHPHPAPVEDCYASLLWAADNAADLGYDPGRIGIAGDSSGGGIAAAIALLARDRGGPALKQQILIYPMLDDRNQRRPAGAPDVLLWSYDDNATGWRALLGTDGDQAEASPYAAPARATDLVGLPPTYLAVGDLDIFCAEDLAYAARLIEAGVAVELHVHPGAPHAFDVMAPESASGKRALADEIRVMRAL